MIVAVCGLHGGSGATTVAVLLAQAAAAERPGRVLLCDSSPATGDIALALGAASTHNLAQLGRLRAHGHQPTTTPWAELPRGLRILARGPGRRTSAPAQAVTQVLADAEANHDLVIVDAGALGAQHAHAILSSAHQVLWTLDATARPARCAHLLASDLVADARDARWQLIASTTGRDGRAAETAQLAELVPSADRVVLIPALQGADDTVRDLAASHLLATLGCDERAVTNTGLLRNKT